MFLKYRLPTLCLDATKPYDLKTHEIPTDMEWLLQLWMIQLATPIEQEATGVNKCLFTITATHGSWWYCWCLEVDGKGFIDGEVVMLPEIYVEMCCFCCWKIVGIYWCRICSVFFYSQLALITITLWRTSDVLFFLLTVCSKLLHWIDT